MEAVRGRLPGGVRVRHDRGSLDYQDPEGKRVDLAISRIRSAAPDQRRGVLLSTPVAPASRGSPCRWGWRRTSPSPHG
ncbi:hypothetical protein NKH77_08165 [Streptomyces sp. M19]